MYMSVSMSVCPSVRLNGFIYLCMYECMYVCMYVCVKLCLFVSLCACMHTLMRDIRFTIN